MIKDDLRNYLNRHPRLVLNDKKRVPAGVVLPLFFKNNNWWILFIKRTETVKYHKGQISFPGGRREPVDKTMLDTALRELNEEIGVVPEKVEILGELDDSFTVTSNYLISTFVGIIPYPYDFKIDPREIAYTFEVPVSALLTESFFREEMRDTGAVNSVVYFYDYEDKVIWGATARILKQFLDIWKSLIAKNTQESNS